MRIGGGVWVCLVANASFEALNWVFPLAVKCSGVSARWKGLWFLVTCFWIAAMRPLHGRVSQWGVFVV